MLRRLSLAFVLVAAVACAGTAGPGGGPVPGQGAEEDLELEQPGVVPDSTCENTSGGNPENFPPFTEVEIEQGVESGEIDRITFRFAPEAGAPGDAPLYFINFTDQLVTDGEGRPVNAQGEAFVVVSIQAVGVDLSGEKPVEVYTGPKRFTPGFEVLREVVHLGDFEGQVSWGLGLSRRSCFHLITARDQIALEFPAA